MTTAERTVISRMEKWSLIYTRKVGDSFIAFYWKNICVELIDCKERICSVNNASVLVCLSVLKDSSFVLYLKYRLYINIYSINKWKNVV